MLEDTPGERFPAPGNKRKIVKEMVPIESAERDARRPQGAGDKVQHRLPECSNAPVILEDSNNIEEGNRPKRPRLTAKVKVDTRPKLAPTRSDSKSVKEMIFEMRLRALEKAQARVPKDDEATTAAGLSNSAPVPDEEPNTSPKFFNTGDKSKYNCMVENESGVSQVEQRATEGDKRNQNVEPNQKLTDSASRVQNLKIYKS